MSTALQQAFDAIDKATSADDWIVAATAKGLIAGYANKWESAHRDMEIVEIEKTLEAPLTNLDTGSDSRTFRIAGKLDKLVRQNGLVLYDHKTTSSDIKDPDAVYWRQLQIASQPSHYELLLLANGVKIDRIVWDVIAKPGIRPKKIAKAEQKQIAAHGEYCGYEVSAETRQAIALDTDPRENGELFQHRLTAECIENHERYFQRRSTPRIEAEIVEYVHELWDHGQAIIDTRNRTKKTGHLPPRNSNACMTYGTPCTYLGVCSGHDQIDSDRWKRKESMHPELDGIGLGLDVLTNSRISCFQTCRRKEFYQYQLGVERIDAEERDAMHFGTVMHLALDSWWLAVSGVSNVNGSSQFSASAADNSDAQLFV